LRTINTALRGLPKLSYLETFMARTSRSANSAAAPESTGNGEAPADINAARHLLATTLHQEHRLLQWLAQAQRLQADALRAWDGAVSVAADNAERAAAWNDLFKVRRDLVSEGLGRLTTDETVLLSSWLDLQTEFAQQMQDGATELASKMWNGAAPAESSPAAPAPTTPAAWLEQSQAAWQSMFRPWGSLFGGHQGR
jgi:hypothetical protein